jgi:APA family basic amino acid/polyamine antiporter
MPNGFTGVWIGASLIFFAFIGFDAVSTAAEECRNPGRDMPIGIIASLGICTVIYVATAIVLTGIEPWQKLGVANPLASAFSSIGLDWAAGIVSLGAVISMTAVLLVFQLGQPRIFFAMSRDGLLPRYFARVHTKYRTPHVTTIWSGIAVGSIAAVTNINEMVELTNIGTLFAFVLVCAGILILRRADPDRPRTFRTPLVPLIPLLGMAMCVYLMLGLPWATWFRFGLWLAAGLAVYFAYGYRHSLLSRGARQ